MTTISKVATDTSRYIETSDIISSTPKLLRVRDPLLDEPGVTSPEVSSKKKFRARTRAWDEGQRQGWWIRCVNGSLFEV